MAANRLDKINTVIAQELGKIIAREVEFEQGTLATITRVETTSDLKHADVFITIYPDTRRGTAFTILKTRAPYLQYLLNEAIPVQHVPHLSFKIEEAKKHEPGPEEEVEALLAQIKKEKS